MSEVKVLYANAVGGWLLEVDGELVPVVRADEHGRAMRVLRAALDAEEYANPEYLAEDHWTREAHALCFPDGDDPA